MTPRERIRAIIARQPADRTGFWTGNPHDDSWPALYAHFGAADQESVYRRLGDDFRWINAGILNTWHAKERHGAAGPLAEAEDPAELERYPWPDPDRLDFGPVLAALEKAGPHYRASGLWTCFYHNVMDLFGMEEYMVKMHTNPALVQAVTDRVCGYYYAANERFFRTAGDLVDGFFFGNDFGTQQDLICGPEQFDRYIMPWFRRFADLGHRHGRQVILHSCGAIHKAIPRLIEAGVDCLHPLQALASRMDAETLARDFGGRIAFMGGIDTQQLLVHGTPAQVAAEVRRVRGLLGPHLIISPSHEALLPDIPPANIEAMARAAAE